MKKWMKGWIEKNAPNFFHIIKEIKRFQKMGYDVKKLYLNHKELNDLFTANTIMKDTGLEIRTTWDKMKNCYFDGILIERSDRMGFIIKRQSSKFCSENKDMGAGGITKSPVRDCSSHHNLEVQ